MTNRTEALDTVAQMVARTFQADGGHNLAYKLAVGFEVNFVLCITKDGQNLSAAFNLLNGDKWTDYFEQDLPPASACEFKFYVYA